MNPIINTSSCGVFLPSRAEHNLLRKPVFLAGYAMLFYLISIFLPACALGFGPSTDPSEATLAANSSYQLVPLNWSNTPSAKPPKFYYPNPMRPYMRRLKESYKISEMTANVRSDLERVKIISGWVNRQWTHHGDCPIQNNDPIAILEAARSGETFSCYEYSLVTSGCLNSIGIKTRTVVLLPRDVERRANGNYHVVAEAYLNDKKKWVMVDAQWDAVPTLNNYPLSVVELQNALTKGLRGIDFGNLKGEMTDLYPQDLAIYLHYLYTPLDNRVIGAKSPDNVGGGVMLIPLGDKPPRRFAMAPVGRFVVTNAVTDFYGTAQP